MDTDTQRLERRYCCCPPRSSWVTNGANGALGVVWGSHARAFTCTQRPPQSQMSHEDFCAATKVFSNVLAVPIIIRTIIIIIKKNISAVLHILFFVVFFDYQQVMSSQSRVQGFGKTSLYKKYNREGERPEALSSWMMQLWILLLWPKHLPQLLPSQRRRTLNAQQYRA